MRYNNLFDATTSLSRKVYRFSGRRVNMQSSWIWNQIARSLDYIKDETSVSSVNFDGEVMILGRLHPVTITVKGDGIHNPMDVIICRK